MNKSKILGLVVVLLAIAVSSVVFSEDDNETISDVNDTIDKNIEINESSEEIIEGNEEVLEEEFSAQSAEIPEDIIIEPINDTELNETDETIEEVVDLDETDDEISEIVEVVEEESISENIGVEDIETEENYLYVDIEEVIENADKLIAKDEFGEYVESKEEEKVEEGAKISDESTIALVISAPDEIMPGSVGSISVYVWNFGEEDVYDVPISITVTDGLELLDDNEIVIDSIGAMSSYPLSFDFETKKYGTYDIEVKSLDIVSKEKVEVRPPHSPLFSIDLSAPPIWPVGTTWDIYVDVYNGGNETAYNTTVTLTLSSDLSTIDPLIKSAGDLATTLPDSHVQLSWPVHVDSSGEHTVTANATCANCIPDSEEQSGNSTTPIVLNFTSILLPDTLTVGNTYQATAIIKNEGSGNASDVNVSIAIPAELSLLGAVTQIVKIDGGETKNVVFNVSAVSSGDSRSLSIRIRHNSTYYDKTLSAQFDTTTVDTEAPTFSNIVANPDPAGVGIVQISFTASEALLSNPTVTVNGNTTVFDSKNLNDYIYNYTVALSDTQGTATIDVSGNDLASNPGSSAGSLVIDYTAPVIDRIEADNYGAVVAPGPNILIDVVESNSDNSLTGTITITRISDMVDVVSNGPLVNGGNGNYTYDWNTAGYNGDEYNISAVLSDSVGTDQDDMIIVLDRVPHVNATLPLIEFTSDTYYLLNLDGYFDDVDGDNLSYSYVAEDGNITVDITDNIANLSNTILDFVGIKNVTFIASDGYFDVNQSTLVNVTPKSDLYIDNIVFSPQYPKENEETNITVFVNNTGLPNTGNFNLSLLVNSVYFDSTIMNIAGESSENFKFVKADWINQTGVNNITAIADYLDEVDETDETNNELSVNITVKQWYSIYGQSTSQIVLSDKDNVSLVNWSTNFGNIYATQASTVIDWANVGPLLSGDFATADYDLGLSGDERISVLYNGAATDTFDVYGNSVVTVPIINSTNNTNFKTGLMKDSSNNYIFATKINMDQDGMFGNYDYELRIPATLRDGVGNVDLWAEALS
ncbi:MAG: CARDB domain-containing protein [Nanoarchaeota archaeon]|nr:CARDB domain-containing protein [Nanoarchaeota archaeon]